jgi:hypothetical protein
MANCVCTVYLTLAAFETAVEALDDTKFLGAFTYREAGTSVEKIVLVAKT